MAESKPKEGKKSPIKLFLILAIVLLLLGGAGAGYYFFLYHPTASGEHAAASEDEGDKKQSEKAEESEPEFYHNVSMPLLVNFPPGSSAKIIKISVAILVKGEASVDVLKKHEPMIRNNLLMAISSVGADKAKTQEGKQELRAMMLNEIGKVMEKMAGKNTAKEVYFTEFVMQ